MRVLILILGLAWTLPSNAETACSPEVILSTSLITVNGEGTTLGAQDAEVLLLNFWAPWCVPCLAEFPKLAQLAKHFEKNRLKILAVAVDGRSDELKRLAHSRKIALPILRDTTGTLAECFSAYSIPKSVFLNSSGKAFYVDDPDTKSRGYVIDGPRDWDAPRFVETLSKRLQNVTSE